MNNLEPRAKIGDVVIVQSYERHSDTLGEAYFLEKRELEVINVYNEDDPHTRYYESNNDLYFIELDILKNLTTNISYE